MNAKERYDLAVKAHQRDQQRPDYNTADSAIWYRKLSAILRDIESEQAGGTQEAFPGAQA